MRVRELGHRVLAGLHAAAGYEPRLRVAAATLVGLVAAQWLVIAVAARSMSHEGWLFGWRVYQGGDDTWYYTTAWTLGHGHLPFGEIGHGWPIVLAPLTAISGPNLLDGIAPLVLLQVVFLVPLGVLCVYGIARSIGGFALGVWAAVVWIGLPPLAVQYFDGRYRDVYVDQLLPQVLGLVPQGDFVSTIALLVSAYFLFRASDGLDPVDALAGGLAAGVAIAIKPANLLFVPAIVGLVVVRRQPRVAGFVAAAAALPVLTSLLWKVRAKPGFLSMPGEHRLAAGSDAAIAATTPVADVVHRVWSLTQFDWGQFEFNLGQIREYSWSLRLLEWLAIAGIIAVARRSPAKALFLGLWLAAFVFVKGSSTSATVFYSGTYFRLLLPALPPFVIGVACLPLLMPGAARAVRASAVRRVVPHRRAIFAAAFVLFAVLPAAAVAAFRPLAKPVVVNDPNKSRLYPVSGDFHLRATRVGRQVRLRWNPVSHGRLVRYAVYRAPAAGGDGLVCDRRPLVCTLHAMRRGVVDGRSFAETPPAGEWAYRAALYVRFTDRPGRGGVTRGAGTVVLLSEPVTVAIR